MTTYTTGFSENQIRVETTAPYNGTSCATAQDGYMTDPADPGNQAHQSALLAAFMSGTEVKLALSGCNSVGRSKIIGVYLKK